MNINEDNYPLRLISLMNLLEITSSKIKCLVETGTNRGEGTVTFASIFDYVYTVELSEQLFKDCINKHKQDNIEFLFGKSTDLLKDIVSKIDDEYLLFLDAHGSGGDTTFDENVGRYGSPVLEELEEVKLNPPEVIVVDDLYLFGNPTLDYPSQEQVINKVKELGKYKVASVNWKNRPQWLCFLKGEE